METVAEYKRFLEKGQIPSKDILRTVFTIDFIFDISLLLPGQLHIPLHFI